MSAENIPLEGTAEVSPPEDYAAYAEYRRTGELPKAAEETSEVDTEEVETGTATESETVEEAEQSEESERDEKGRFKPKQRGLDKRFHELTSEIRGLKAALAERATPDVASPRVEPQQQQEAPQGKPESKDFDSYEEFYDALTDWKIDQRERARAAEQQQRQQQEQQRTKADTWQKREEQIRTTHKDYEEALQKLTIPNTPAVADIREFLSESEVGPALLYHLAKNPKEAERIVSLSPHRAIGELGKLEDKLSSKQVPNTATKTATKAPPPPQTVGAKSSPALKPLREVEDPIEYQARRRKGEKP